MWYVTPQGAGLSVYFTPPPHVYFPLVAHSGGECLETLTLMGMSLRHTYMYEEFEVIKPQNPLIYCTVSKI